MQPVFHAAPFPVFCSQSSQANEDRDFGKSLGSNRETFQKRTDSPSMNFASVNHDPAHPFSQSSQNENFHSRWDIVTRLNDSQLSSEFDDADMSQNNWGRLSKLHSMHYAGSRSTSEPSTFISKGHVQEGNYGNEKIILGKNKSFEFSRFTDNPKSSSRDLNLCQGKVALSSLSLEKYAELFLSLVKDTSNTKVQSCSGVDELKYRHKDLQQILSLHCLYARSRAKKDILERMVGLELVSPFTSTISHNSLKDGNSNPCLDDLPILDVSEINDDLSALEWLENPIGEFRVANTMDTMHSERPSKIESNRVRNSFETHFSHKLLNNYESCETSVLSSSEPEASEMWKKIRGYFSKEKEEDSIKFANLDLNLDHRRDDKNKNEKVNHQATDAFATQFSTVDEFFDGSLHHMGDKLKESQTTLHKNITFEKKNEFCDSKTEKKLIANGDDHILQEKLESIPAIECGTSNTSELKIDKEDENDNSVEIDIDDSHHEAEHSGSIKINEPRSTSKDKTCNIISCITSKHVPYFQSGLNADSQLHCEPRLTREEATAVHLILPKIVSAPGNISGEGSECNNLVFKSCGEQNVCELEMGLIPKPKSPFNDSIKKGDPESLVQSRNYEDSTCVFRRIIKRVNELADYATLPELQTSSNDERDKIIFCVLSKDYRDKSSKSVLLESGLQIGKIIRTCPSLYNLHIVHYNGDLIHTNHFFTQNSPRFTVRFFSKKTHVYSDICMNLKDEYKLRNLPDFTRLAEERNKKIGNYWMPLSDLSFYPTESSHWNLNHQKCVPKDYGCVLETIPESHVDQMAAKKILDCNQPSFPILQPFSSTPDSLSTFPPSYTNTEPNMNRKIDTYSKSPDNICAKMIDSTSFHSHSNHTLNKASKFSIAGPFVDSTLAPNTSTLPIVLISHASPSHTSDINHTPFTHDFSVSGAPTDTVLPTSNTDAQFGKNKENEQNEEVQVCLPPIENRECVSQSNECHIANLPIQHLPQKIWVQSVQEAEIKGVNECLTGIQTGTGSDRVDHVHRNINSNINKFGSSKNVTKTNSFFVYPSCLHSDSGKSKGIEHPLYPSASLNEIVQEQEKNESQLRWNSTKKRSKRKWGINTNSIQPSVNLRTLVIENKKSKRLKKSVGSFDSNSQKKPVASTNLKKRMKKKQKLLHLKNNHSSEVTIKKNDVVFVNMKKICWPAQVLDISKEKKNVSETKLCTHSILQRMKHSAGITVRFFGDEETMNVSIKEILPFPTHLRTLNLENHSKSFKEAVAEATRISRLQFLHSSKSCLPNVP